MVPPEEGVYVAVTTCVSVVSRSLKDTWNTDTPRAEFSGTDTADASGRFVIVGAVLMSGIINQKNMNFVPILLCTCILS